MFRRKKIVLLSLSAGLILVSLFLILLFNIDGTVTFYQRIIEKYPSASFPVKMADFLFPKGYLFNEQVKELPHFNIKMSFKDIQAILHDVDRAKKKNFNSKRTRTHRKVKVDLDGKQCSGRLMLKGATAGNYKYNKKSYSVKIRKKKYLHGYRKLLFITPAQQEYLSPLVSNVIAEELGLFYNKRELVTLSINGIMQGVYLLEEPLDKDFLERREVSNGVMINIKDNWVENHRNNRFGVTWGHTTGADWEISNIEKLKTDFSKTVLHRFWELQKMVYSEDYQQIDDFFDMDYIARYEVYRNILASDHDTRGDNLKLFYSLTNGKFYPIVRSEGDIHPLKIVGGSVTKSYNSYDSHRNIKAPNLFRLFHKNENFRRLKFKYLIEMLQKRSAVTGKVKKLIGEKKDVVIYDHNDVHSFVEKHYIIKNIEKILNNNFDLLRKQFEFMSLFINIIKEKSKATIEIIPDGDSFIQMRRAVLMFRSDFATKNVKVVCGHGNQYQFSQKVVINKKREIDLTALFNKFLIVPDYDHEMDLIRTKFWCSFEAHNHGDFQLDINAKNVFLGEEVSKEFININYATGNTKKSEKAIAATLRALGAQVLEDKVVFVPGKYQLLKTLNIPQRYEVRMEGGAEIRIGPGVSLVMNSSLLVDGKNKKVVIKNLVPKKPYGVVAVVGDDRSVTSKIVGLDISGGSEAIVDGIFFSGGLSLYHTDVELRDSRVHDHCADDGLNIKYGKVLISNTVFSGNFADQVDLDFCQGEVRDSFFDGAAKDSNGDGLDLSGSRMLVRNNVFELNSDKGISVGEKTYILVSKNDFFKNGLAIASKDMSKVFSYKNYFKGNQTVFAAYRKKEKFGGGYIFSLADRYEKNVSSDTRDNESSIKRQTSNIEIEKFISKKFEIKKSCFVKLFDMIEKTGKTVSCE